MDQYPAPDPAACPMPDAQPFRFSQLQAYVDSHLSDRLTLETVARECGISTSYVSQLFRRNLGMGFHQYLSRRRLEAAKDLIRSGIPLEQVGKAVGYQDYSCFYRAFCKYCRCSPVQFRREQFRTP